eukprot:CAMPEP_0206327506 /NCGR_PEP_ID=MMETSP0106_2-20121207/22185_1 /ASSEMBLY_ACC=CAM_ASM_000206 /TAXON_ID=81532 /ORGANISM="Acanthoeca-like sp., Strain 10tr" /LENGTH=126 /DNA_ID=CAMNT_0053760129 /DNA_START=37 /DNA_END=414 /DNA_ORIENTATION=+
MSREKRYFLHNPLNVVDLASVVPFYILLIAGSTSANGFAAIRAVRVVRVLKVGKVGGRSSSVEDLFLAMTYTQDQLVQFVVLFFCQALFWSVVVFYIEVDKGDPEFSSVPASLWWGYVTFTTVGYG